VVNRPSGLEDVTFVTDGTPSPGIPAASCSPTILTVPLHDDGRPLGVLGCADRTPAADWSPDIVRQAQTIGDVLASALARKRTEDALRASESVKSAILSSLTSGVVVIDNSGRIINVNDRWRSSVGDSAPPEATRPGADYLQFYRDMAGSGVSWAADAATGIEGVARGTHSDFTLEHHSDEPGSGRWFALRAVPLDRLEGGAVVTHTDISTQRRVEMETERMRSELAHVLRASTTAALAASLAHQLNQPLTGIVTNARAAERFLDGVEPDLDESRASLRDIADDGKRAGEIIVRLRAFLQQDDGQTASVDMNRIVGEVVGLVSSDIRVGNTSLETQLEQQPACVEANPTQLRQLLLNLLVNALEAVADSPPSDRRVITRCMLTASSIELSIVDNGAGFTAMPLDDVFDAFYTTKARGMGLGLFIARSIVEGHGGTIGARNNPDRGATVWFTLPRVACGAT
jgi:signal transduction histidine kinase